MVGFVPGTRTIDITNRRDLMIIPQGKLYTWKKRPKLQPLVHEWMEESIGQGIYWTADPTTHGVAWGLEHHANVDWKSGSKTYDIYASILSFADADRAMLFKLTW